LNNADRVIITSTNLNGENGRRFWVCDDSLERRRF
jgi:hypothetical protein